MKGNLPLLSNRGIRNSLLFSKTTKVVIGAAIFENNSYNGHTFEKHLKQAEHLTESKPKTAIVERGYKREKEN